MDTAMMNAHGAAEIDLMVFGAGGLPEEPILDDLTDLSDEFDEFASGAMDAWSE